MDYIGSDKPKLNVTKQIKDAMGKPLIRDAFIKVEAVRESGAISVLLKTTEVDMIEPMVGGALQFDPFTDDPIMVLNFIQQIGFGVYKNLGSWNRKSSDE